MLKKKKRSQDIPVLTDEEIEILKLGRDDPDIVTDYFFRPAGAEHGWLFDDNFTEKGKWQKEACIAEQSDLLIIGGFATGKTTWISASACVWGMLTHPDFKFLNAAPSAKQAKYAYSYIMTISAGTPFEKFIYTAREKPYPYIEIRFWVYDTLVISTLEFMSVADDAESIFGWEGDWLNIDEGFLLDDLEGTLTVLGSRVRGSIQGRERLGRISITTNSHDNDYGWYMVDLASQDPENYLLMTLDSADNKNVTEKQLSRMLARIPKDQHERWLRGVRPEGRGTYFSKDAVFACESVERSDLLESMVKDNIDGYFLSRDKGVGVDYFTMPKIQDHIYMLFGDIGIDNRPKKNSPVLSVFDVTEFPREPADMCAFWWGMGNGSVTPFVGFLVRFLLMYRPIYSGIDSTGPQKNFAEIVNSYLKGGRITDEKITHWLGEFLDDEGTVKIPQGIAVAGMDFSGSKKDWYLRSLQLSIESGLIRWPKIVNGVRSQLVNYDRSKDKGGTSKVPNDVLVVMAEAAHATRRYFYIDPQDEKQDEETPTDSTPREISRSTRRSEVRSVSRASTR